MMNPMQIMQMMKGGGNPQQMIMNTSFDDHSGYDRKIMSRKQQLIPSISSRIEQL